MFVCTLMAKKCFSLSSLIGVRCVGSLKVFHWQHVSVWRTEIEWAKTKEKNGLEWLCHFCVCPILVVAHCWHALYCVVLWLRMLECRCSLALYCTETHTHMCSWHVYVNGTGKTQKYRHYYITYLHEVLCSLKRKEKQRTKKNIFCQYFSRPQKKTSKEIECDSMWIPCAWLHCTVQ